MQGCLLLSKLCIAHVLFSCMFCWCALTHACCLSANCHCKNCKLLLDTASYANKILRVIQLPTHSMSVFIAGLQYWLLALRPLAFCSPKQRVTATLVASVRPICQTTRLYTASDSTLLTADQVVTAADLPYYRMGST